MTERSSSSEQEPLPRAVRLVHFQVDGLFGLYTRRIPLSQTEHITAIVGPNGSGKTVCLKLIQGLFAQKFSIFYSVQFDRCAWVFDSGEGITLTKKAPPKPQPGEPANRKSRKERLHFEYKSSTGSKAAWTPSSKETPIERRTYGLERALPFLTRIGPDIWRHDNTGEHFDFEELLDTFGDRIPKPIRESYFGQAPKELADLLGRLKCHLIETQRLLVMPGDLHIEDSWSTTGSQSSSNLSVDRKSDLLKTKIKTVLTEYASLSQSLDRAFPQRILSNASIEILDETKISDRLKDLEQRRQELEAAGILKTEFESLPSIPQNIDQSLLRAISVYINHTNQKLNVFSDLLRRIQVFEALVNKLFIDKSIKITQADGIVVRSRMNTRIPLRVLSSGEQHQLVLIFELLFETHPGELILIDEPELSLHISWQQAFIDDLKRIIQINPLDVVLATHSPALIGSHYNLAVELGD